MSSTLTLPDILKLLEDVSSSEEENQVEEVASRVQDDGQSEEESLSDITMDSDSPDDHDDHEDQDGHEDPEDHDSPEDPESPPATAVCSRCRATKPLSEFMENEKQFKSCVPCLETCRRYARRTTRRPTRRTTRRRTPSAARRTAGRTTNARSGSQRRPGNNGDIPPTADDPASHPSTFACSKCRFRKPSSEFWENGKLFKTCAGCRESNRRYAARLAAR
ncbi:uncharacterized protein N7483_006516 [Penicillium malachiteum]|uniref:uncharacterized protein n=1 Tax=Penicillium malachiteum TaxID=1324776 RepID=UPI0025475394|nr:uncharacterized protein N7483_006516 [Penicillium malachiteum]KAJ5725159.1 hypothetical protein N7483_006516 [Penicillium malachiteum]